MNETKHDKPSKSQLKRDAEKLQDFGSHLVKLPISVLNKFPIPDDLFDAIKLAQSIRQNSALKRQLHYIGKIIRHHDNEIIEKIQDSYDKHYIKQYHNTTQFHLYENWRDKFINNDKSVFDHFIAEYPDLDRQRLHQLQRQAIKERQLQKTPKYARLLFNYLKEIINKHNEL